MDKFEKRDDAKEHLIQSGFLSAHSRNPHTEKCLSNSARLLNSTTDYLMEKYTKSVLKSIYVNTPGYILSECKLLGEYCQYIESVQPVLKGQQP